MMDKSKINDLVQKLGLKTTFIFGLTGFFISFLIVLINGGGFPEILLRPLVSGIILALFWNLGYIVIKKFVPDLVNEVQSTFPKSQNGMSENNAQTGSFDDASGDFNFEINNSENSDKGSSSNQNNREKISEDIKLDHSDHEEGTTVKTPASAKPKQRIGSDEMLVQGFAIKKDPELMARTIQHVLDTDKE
jgi:hypothetical protein